MGACLFLFLQKKSHSTKFVLPDGAAAAGEALASESGILRLWVLDHIVSEVH